MIHIVSGRLICNTDNQARVRTIFESTKTKLGLVLELTVCEPFAEQQGQFDLCFSGEFVPPKDTDIFALFESWLAALGGEWQQKNMARFQGGRYQCSAVMDHQDAAIGQIVWMSLSLDPT